MDSKRKPVVSDKKLWPAKSNSHLSVVLATNLYLPRYDAEPTGDKRIRLELVRWWCGVEAPLAMPCSVLSRTEDYQQNGYQNHPTIQFPASQAGTLLRSMLMVAQGAMPALDG